MTALVLGPMAAAQRVDVWLEVGHVRGHLDAGAARRLYPYLVLGKYGLMTMTSSPGSVTADTLMAMEAAAPTVM